MAALDVQVNGRVFDIARGVGETTCDAARAAPHGAVLGVDVSEVRLDIARRRAEDAGLANVSFLCADAQTHRFPEAEIDLGLSRFGTMFFADPVVAFTNIASAPRPGASFVQMVWQHRHQQEWAAVLRAVFGHHPAPSTGADAFFTRRAEHGRGSHDQRRFR